ncbi:DUF418 domain-containing protein [Sphingomonas sp.]|uniref:DUF418 domain-containing protein n=1 Tax=Sphingomonas sp. TaxID=28214 RepID=UPI001D7699D7|nr:DUF418 domain-containing protein [Sphingomonas sp.]MBX9795822.1 DUF418 domain-containing protein [Sphingomonas sp.]
MSTTPPLQDRITTLDVIRGVAVMGILTMNIVAFAMPEVAYLNPRAYGADTPVDMVTYLIDFVLFDGKMRGLFSFLFGASTLLVIERATAKGESAGAIHYARMGWLLVFGLIHLYLIWWGDILTHYALIGMILFLFRKRSVKWLVRIGAGMLVLQMLVLSGLPLAIATVDAQLAQPNPPKEMVEQARDFADTFGVPSRAKTEKELALHRGSYATIVAQRVREKAWVVPATFALVGFETLAYMLFGMALLKSGMLRGEWPAERYRRWAILGLGTGIVGYGTLAVLLAQSGYTPFAVALYVLALTVPIRPVMIIGWASAIALFARGRGALVARVAAAGRMAFTNYLMTSILCTTLFYGYGLGLYGHLGRAQLYLVVLGMWALMLLWSKPWLDRFAYGPFEWLWRSLARGRPQPMHKPAAA